MAKWQLNRRTMLRGVLGGAAVAVALPPLEAMFNSHGTAHADGTPIPKRLGIFFWGNGVKLDRVESGQHRRRLDAERRARAARRASRTTSTSCRA